MSDFQPSGCCWLEYELFVQQAGRMTDVAEWQNPNIQRAAVSFVSFVLTDNCYHL